MNSELSCREKDLSPFSILSFCFFLGFVPLRYDHNCFWLIPVIL